MEFIQNKDIHTLCIQLLKNNNIIEFKENIINIDVSNNNDELLLLSLFEKKQAFIEENQLFGKNNLAQLRSCAPSKKIQTRSSPALCPTSRSIWRGSFCQRPSSSPKSNFKIAKASYITTGALANSRTTPLACSGATRTMPLSEWA